MPAPLFITRDESLLDELVRLAAAAGVTPEVAHEPDAALRSWVGASLVLVGLDLAPALLRLAPPRRADVVVVTWAGASPDVFRQALGLGARDVVELPAGDTALVDLLADLVDEVPARGLTVGVIGGSGGAGASTFACALGQVAARSGATLVVDLDPGGPGLDRVLGLEAVDGIGWPDLEATAGRLGARALRDAVPARHGLGVLTWPPGRAAPLSPDAVRATLSAAQRGHETVVLDLPRSADPLTDELASRVDQLLVVTTATVPSVTSTARVCARHAHAQLRLVVRGSGVAASEITAVTGVPVAATMSAQRRLDESVDLGFGPLRAARGPLHRAATTVLAAARHGAAA